ncbi:hypothetical protein CPB83DRAFT_837117 [Crepidotus variabilis]|uniref:Uncharacterized protein n=1 Tax=Crepidotus variabilis TaxID=179855 RepID=A0A9P6JMY1_9AGAR|nr:hypothetical protein CPB83DRAFT_837117 [Crepidotus variabilis]
MEGNKKQFYADVPDAANGQPQSQKHFLHQKKLLDFHLFYLGPLVSQEGLPGRLIKSRKENPWFGSWYDEGSKKREVDVAEVGLSRHGAGKPQVENVVPRLGRCRASVFCQLEGKQPLPTLGLDVEGSPRRNVVTWPQGFDLQESTDKTVRGDLTGQRADLSPYKSKIAQESSTRTDLWLLQNKKSPL